MVTTSVPQARRDGRSTRWEAHRRARRDELVDAALRAIAALGPEVAMDDIAAQAGTSKTVLYRHFADKGKLHAAVAARVDATVLRALRRAVTNAASSRQALAAAITAYLHLVAADPHVYRFVLSAPRTDASGGQRAPGAVGAPDAAGSGPLVDPLHGLTSAIGTELARLIVARLSPPRPGPAPPGLGVLPGGDPCAARTDTRSGTWSDTPGPSATTTTLAQALPWAHGIVWLVRGAADVWAAAGTPTDADELAAQLTRLAWDGLGSVLATGAGLDPLAPAAPTPDPAPHPSRDPEPTLGRTLANSDH